MGITTSIPSATATGGAMGRAGLPSISTSPPAAIERGDAAAQVGFFSTLVLPPAAIGRVHVTASGSLPASIVEPCDATATGGANGILVGDLRVTWLPVTGTARELHTYSKHADPITSGPKTSQVELELQEGDVITIEQSGNIVDVDRPPNIVKATLR